MAWRAAVMEALAGLSDDQQAAVREAIDAVWALRTAAERGEPLTAPHPSTPLQAVAALAPLGQRAAAARLASRFVEAREQVGRGPAEPVVGALDGVRVALDGLAANLAARRARGRALRQWGLAASAVLAGAVGWWLRSPMPLAPQPTFVVSPAHRYERGPDGLRPAADQAVDLRAAAAVYFGHAQAPPAPDLQVLLSAVNPSFGSAHEPRLVTVTARRGEAASFPFERLPVDVSLQVEPTDTLPRLALGGLGPLGRVRLSVKVADRLTAEAEAAEVAPRTVLPLEVDTEGWQVLAPDDEGELPVFFVQVGDAPTTLETFQVDRNAPLPPGCQPVASPRPGRWAQVEAIEDLQAVPGATVLWRAPIAVQASGEDLRGAPLRVDWSGTTGTRVAWYQGPNLSRDDPRCAPGPQPDSDADHVPQYLDRMPDAAAQLLGVRPEVVEGARPLIELAATLQTAALAPGQWAVATRTTPDLLAPKGRLVLTATLERPGPGAWTVDWFAGDEPVGVTTVHVPPRLPDEARYDRDGWARAKRRLSGGPP
ncbi:MAG: hypothetical protein H6702_18925 [Myxococcales bacterium]|nr:hypothetical protein [Myxococcales bacterium]